MQRARPVADAYIGDESVWTGVPDDIDLFRNIDEAVPDDGNFVKARFTPGVDQEAEWLLGPLDDPNVHTGHTLSFRAFSTTIQLVAIASLWHGSPGSSGRRLVRAIGPFLLPTSGPALYTVPLNGLQAALIEDYRALYFRFKVLGDWLSFFPPEDPGEDPLVERDARLTWVELSVPDVSVPPVVIDLSDGPKDRVVLTGQGFPGFNFPKTFVLEGRDTLRTVNRDPTFVHSPMTGQRPFTVIVEGSVPDATGPQWYCQPVDMDDAASGGVCAVSGFLFPGSRMTTDGQGRRVGDVFARE